MNTDCYQDHHYMCNICRWAEKDSIRCLCPAIYKDPPEDAYYEKAVDSAAIKEAGE